MLNLRVYRPIYILFLSNTYVNLYLTILVEYLFKNHYNISHILIRYKYFGAIFVQNFTCLSPTFSQVKTSRRRSRKIFAPQSYFLVKFYMYVSVANVAHLFQTFHHILFQGPKFECPFHLKVSRVRHVVTTGCTILYDATFRCAVQAQTLYEVSQKVVKYCKNLVCENAESKMKQTFLFKHFYKTIAKSDC